MVDTLPKFRLCHSNQVTPEDYGLLTAKKSG